MAVTSFPGGTSLSHLDIYSDAAPDGTCGGSPHMHLASTEAYLVVAGEGALQTIGADGFRETPLSTGTVVWFTPGTIHRAVNRGRLQVLVLMSNAGLPEAGDAVMTFPADIVADAEAYAAAAALGDEQGRAERVARRRDLAVSGFEVLRDAVQAGERGPLERFYAAAAELVRDRSASWARIVREGPLAQAQHSAVLVEDIARGAAAHLAEGRVHEAAWNDDARLFGMCGRIRAYDVTTTDEESR